MNYRLLDVGEECKATDHYFVGPPAYWAPCTPDLVGQRCPKYWSIRREDDGKGVWLLIYSSEAISGDEALKNIAPYGSNEVTYRWRMIPEADTPKLPVDMVVRRKRAAATEYPGTEPLWLVVRLQDESTSKHTAWQSACAEARARADASKDASTYVVAHIDRTFDRPAPVAPRKLEWRRAHSSKVKEWSLFIFDAKPAGGPEYRDEVGRWAGCVWEHATADWMWLCRLGIGAVKGGTAVSENEAQAIVEKEVFL